MATGTITRTLTVDVSGLDDDQIESLEQGLDALLARVLDPDAVEAVLGWTPKSFAELLQRLRHDGAGVQADCIEFALEHGGYITRNQVYKTAGWSQNARTLKGFTRPVTRIVNLLVEEGVVPADAVAVLESSYQDGVKADGFSVPSALIDLL